MASLAMEQSDQELSGSEGPIFDSGLCAYQDLAYYYFNLDKVSLDDKRIEELKNIPAHLARVLQRQRTITHFFEILPRRLEAAGIRVLTLENRFPVGRLLVPADTLSRTLDVLDPLNLSRSPVGQWCGPRPRRCRGDERDRFV